MEIEQKIEHLKALGFKAVFPMTTLPFAERGPVRLYFNDIDANSIEALDEIIAIQEEIANVR